MRVVFLPAFFVKVDLDPLGLIGFFTELRSFFIRPVDVFNFLAGNFLAGTGEVDLEEGAEET